MSGGVDSSVAACILKKSGYEVIGCTMRLFLCRYVSAERQCCSPEDIVIAKRTAEQLGIKHYIVDRRKIFGKYVIENFVSEYLRGRTPNPCIVCNMKIKFDKMLEFAKGLGCNFIATGHYARIGKKSEVGSWKSEVYVLKKGIDKTKDQSYFLYGLTQKNLPHILFPLGNYKKTEIRKLANELMLKSANKKESQEICFVGNADYRRSLKHRLTQIKPQINTDIKPGKIVDIFGKVVGMHKGIPYYTIGQRQGLGISVGYPTYVVKIDAEKNQITVGRKEELLGKEFLVQDISWTVSQPNKSPIIADVRIRYKHKESKAKIFLQKNNTAKIVFYKPQLSITPGQSAVFYKKDIVLGGGIIKAVISD